MNIHWQFQNKLNSLNILEDLVEQWNTFKHETFQTTKEFAGDQPKSRGGNVSKEMLAEIEGSRAAGLAGNHD